MASLHDKNAPYWAAALLVLTTTGLATNWLELGTFFKGYALDMAGPAWSYILFRGLFTAKADNWWTRLFTPSRTLIAFLLIAFAIEMAQYFKLYDATYDPLDFVAYASLLIPVYLLEVWQIRREGNCSK